MKSEQTMATGFAGSGDTLALEHSLSNETMLNKLIEPILMTAIGGVAGAVIGGMIGMVIMGPQGRRNPRVLTQSARECARGYSAVGAVWFGIESTMEGIRGKGDLTSRLVGASGGGLTYSFMSQGFKVKPANALFWAAWSVFSAGTLFKVNEIIRSRNAQYAFYTEARAMLSKLGLEEYEKNFKKGHLTDYTLPFLTDSDLKEVNIPPGARVLILDHIKRYNKMVNRK